MKPTDEIKEEINIRKIGDYILDFTKLIKSIEKAKEKINRIEYCLSPEFEELYCTDLINKLKQIADDKQSFTLLNLDIDRLDRKS